MRLRHLLEAVGLDEVRQLAVGLWPDDPVARLRDKADRLRAELHWHHAILVRERRLVESLHRSIAHQAEREESLSRRRAAAVDVCQQEPIAMELAAIQGTLAYQRSRLQRRERRYQAHLARLRHLRRALARLQEKVCRLQLQHPRI